MKSAKVLLVEDDENLREALADTLALAGFDWIEADSAEQAMLQLKKQPVDIVISDVQMAGMNGIFLLRNIKHHYPNLPVLLMTAYANIEDAVETMKEGAVDYLAKPFAPEVLLNTIHQHVCEQVDDNEAIAVDEKSAALLLLAKKVAITDANVMILGPSGTGKEVMAKYIHQHSSRASKPFVAINCAAIPENMLEATLFGYEKGAFTGAVQASPGKFEQAQNGTILLDEISEMDLALQAKLLRVLQEREVERLGARKSIQLDVRVLATSNRDLRLYVEEGHFREDLYYRLNVFPLTWPALAERPDDIIPLAEHLLTRHCQREGRAAPTLAGATKNKLLAYPWHGNVRELDNVMQRALILSQSEYIYPEDVLLEGVDWQQASGLQQAICAEYNSASAPRSVPKPLSKPQESANNDLGDELKEQEFSLILAALQRCQSRKDVAVELGISPRTLRYKLAKMREAGIDITR